MYSEDSVEIFEQKMRDFKKKYGEDPSNMEDIPDSEKPWKFTVDKIKNHEHREIWKQAARTQEKIHAQRLSENK